MSTNRKKSGIMQMVAERYRQVRDEGYTPQHDQQNSVEDLINAALAYTTGDPDYWPWDLKYFKRTTDERDFVKAGALIAAAIDRINTSE